jgi:DNA-binding beta-propeller fold protein YncE
VTCSSDGKTLALNNASHNLQPGTSTLFIDLETLKPVATWNFKVKDTQIFSSTKPGVFSNDGKQYIMTERNNAILIYDLATKSLTRSVPVAGASWNGTLSPDGKYYATLANPGKAPERRTREEPAADLHPQFRVVLLEWQNPDAKPIELIGPRGLANHVAFNPNGKSLAVAATGGVHLFDLNGIEGFAR